MKAAGLVGAVGAGAAPVAPGTAGAAALGSGAFALAGRLMGVGFLAEIAQKFGILKGSDASNGIGRGVLEFLDPGLADRVYGPKKEATDDKASDDKPRAWVDPPSRTDKLKDSIDQNTKALRDQQDKLARDLIKKTSLDGNGTYSLSAMKGEVQASGWNSWLKRNGHAGYDADDPQNPANTGSQINRGLRGHIRSLRGEVGAGGGSANSNPQNSVASAAMLDAIAGTESGKAGYDAVLVVRV
ncbi:hypothetical protein MKK55_11295 [Methylobacterium sp. J-059]|uniref:hypothetical protein n=1 Tax=Methylobacterium sp. J-059 TaxID=2836643 RepID=UPI001FBA038C|nr:hypothetical protein [Methylobacterium sp. J-059]MCJ2039520.1 hypothetical protein [Methylobacterium sp. J-059]